MYCVSLINFRIFIYIFIFIISLIFGLYFQIKITIFSLVSTVVAEIDNPKAIENGIVFSPCEKYLVVAQRINSEDYLKVYDCDTWEAIKVNIKIICIFLLLMYDQEPFNLCIFISSQAFAVETRDLASISFSPKDLVIAVLESALEVFNIFAYYFHILLLLNFTFQIIKFILILNKRNFSFKYYICLYFKRIFYEYVIITIQNCFNLKAVCLELQ